MKLVVFDELCQLFHFEWITPCALSDLMANNDKKKNKKNKWNIITDTHRQKIPIKLAGGGEENTHQHSTTTVQQQIKVVNHMPQVMQNKKTAGGGRTHLFVACLRRSTIDHVPLSRGSLGGE